MKISTLALLSGLALVGCGTDHQSSDANDSIVPVAAGASHLTVYAALSNGAPPVDGRFALKHDAYFNVRLVESPSTLAAANAAARDYYFQVRDAADHVLSNDALECRRVTIGADGRIMSLFEGTSASGDSCVHAFAFDTYGSGGLTIALAPYNDSATIIGLSAAYKLVLAPVRGFHGFDETALSATFMVNLPSSPDLVAVCGNGLIEQGEECDGGESCSAECTAIDPPNPAVCGNNIKEAGEECDDGNLDLNDGCNAHCHIETLCCCGNGSVEPGEQCDDGNDNDGDGCSSSCQFE